MNTADTGTGTGNDTGRDNGHDTAVGRAELCTAGWEDAVRLQRWATPDHADFYALAGEMVAALDDLAHVLHRQVTRYGQGRRARGAGPRAVIELALAAVQQRKAGWTRA